MEILLQIHDHQRTHQPKAAPAKYAETLLAVSDGEAVKKKKNAFSLKNVVPMKINSTFAPDFTMVFCIMVRCIVLISKKLIINKIVKFKKEKMNGKFLHRMNFSGLSKALALLMMVIFIAYSPVLTAQYCRTLPPCPDNNQSSWYTRTLTWAGEDDWETRLAVLGTPCTRIAANVVEVPQGLRIDVIGIGPFEMDFVEFGFFYNSDKYVLTNSGYVNAIPYGNLDGLTPNTDLEGAIKLWPDLVAEGFTIQEVTDHRYPGTGTNTANLHCSYLNGKAAVTSLFAVLDNAYVQPLHDDEFKTYANPVSGKIVNLLTFYLKALPGATAFEPEDIGLGVINVASYYSTLSWGFGQEINYFLTGRPSDFESEDIHTSKDYFLLRSETSVNTLSFTKKTATSVDLNGTITRPWGPECDILDNVFESSPGIIDTTREGRLEHDKIIKYGFIYTEKIGDPTLTHTEYSQILNGACSIDLANNLPASPGALPSPCGTYNVVYATGDPSTNNKSYSLPVTGLEEGKCYYGWAFAIYTFETSEEYPLIGERIEFCPEEKEEEEECDPLVGSIYVLSQPTCGEENGSIKIEVMGSSSYQYSVNGEPFESLPSDGIIGDLKAGHYTIKVQGDNSCEDVTRTLALVNSAAATVVTGISSTNAAGCSSPGNGKMTFTFDGSDDFEYNLTGVAPWTTGAASPITISDLSTGDYTLYIKDKNGCVNPGGSFTIGTTASPLFNFTVAQEDPATCAGDKGLLSITDNGSAATKYRINKGLWIDLDAGYAEVSLPAGSYEVELTDGACISAPKIGTITFGPSTLEASGAENASTTCGLHNGSIVLTINNGTAPYYYNIDGSDNYLPLTTLYINNLSAGKYDIKVKDASCVTNVYGVEVHQGLSLPPIAGTIYTLSQPTCGHNNGSIKVVITGDADPSGYEYSLNGSPFGPLPTDGIIGQLEAGHYTVTVRSVGGGCSDLSQTLALVNGNAATVVTNIDVANAANCGSTGSVTFYVDGSKNFSYKIDGGTPVPVVGLSTVTVSGLSIGDHTLSIIDENICENPGGSFTIGASNPGFTFELSELLTATCTGSYGLLGITVTSGTAIEYRINHGTWVTMVDNYAEVPVPAGWYEVELSASSTCISLPKEIKIGLDGSTLSFLAEGDEPTSCGQSNGSIELTITSGTTPYYYSIDGGILYSEIESPFIIDNLSAGFYDIKLKDGAECVTNAYGVEVKQGVNYPIVTGTISVEQQPTCGSSDGSIKVIAGGATTYNYSCVGDNGVTQNGVFNTATGGIITGLKSGNYTVTVWVIGGCEAISHILALVNSDAATVVNTLNVTPATDCMSNNGKLNFTVTGVSTFWYQLNQGTTVVVGPTQVTNQPSVEVSPLAAGDYTLTIFDNKSDNTAGCANAGGNFTIGVNNPVFTFEISEVLEATCSGANGVLGIKVLTGKDLVTDYRINEGVWVPMSGNYVEVSLPAGVYDVELRSSATCISLPKRETIGLDSEGMGVTFETATPTSCGQNNGTIKFDFTKADVPFYYSIDGTDPTIEFESPYIINNLPAGKYDVKIKDNNGCIANFYGIEIRQGSNDPVIAGTIYALSSPTCGNNNGSIKVAVTGASSYEYILNGAAPQPLSADGIISGLGAGHYTVKVQASGGDCSDVTQTLALVNSDATTLVTGINVTNAADCTGTTFGQITFNVEGVGGSASYQYKVDGGSWMTGSYPSVTVPNIAVGEHFLYINTNGGTCENPGGAFTIGAITPGTFSFAVNQISPATCAGANGLLGITVTGTATDYRINHGEWIAMSGNSVSVSVPAGTYTVEVRDGACIATSQQMAIGLSGSTLVAEATQKEKTTCGKSNGSIELKITNGTGPFEYSIDGGVIYSSVTSDPFIINNLAAGFYDVKVKDGGCVTNVYGVEVHQGLNQSAITGSIYVVKQPTCNNPDGEIKVIALGATGYNYSCDGDNGVTQTGTFPAGGGTIAGLKAGNYTVTVEPIGGGCNDITQILTLANSDAATVVTNITVIPATDCSSNGSIEFTINGSSDFEYQIDGTTAGSWTIATPSPITVPNLSVGDHTLYIKDENNCINPGGSFTIGANDPDGLEFVLNEVLKATCTGSNGVLGITVTDGTATAYRVNHGEWTDMSGTYVEVSVLAGVYDVELRNTVSCISVPQTQIIGLDATDMKVTVDDAKETSCGQTNGTIILAIEDGTDPFYYSIDGTYPMSELTSPYTITGLSAGKYDIKVRDNTGCVTNLYGIEVPQGGNEPLIVGTIYVLSQPVCEEENGSIRVIATGASSYEYILNGGTPKPLPTGGIISGLAAGNYTITVQAAGGGGCSDISQNLLLVNSDATTVVTNISTTPAANCGGTGSVTFDVDGFPVYQYSIDGGSTWNPGAASVTISSIAIGEYTLLIRDNTTLCENPGGAFTISASGDAGIFEFTASQLSAATCKGNGVLSIDIVSGTATDYRINNGLWIPMSGNHVEVPVPAGWYDVEVRSSATCILEPETVEITIGGKTFAATATEDAPTSCGLHNGIIEVTVTPGVTPYYYSIDGGVTYSSAITANPFTINNLSAGSYDIKIKDSDLCIVNAYNVEVHQGLNTPTITGSIYVKEQPTCGNPNGEITVVTLGTESHYYTIVGDNGYSDNSSFPAGGGIIIGLEAGHYTVTVETTNHCSDITQTLALTNSDAATIVKTLVVTDADNCTSDNGSITFTVSGEVPYWYDIDNSGSPTKISHTDPVTVPVSIGDHTLTIMDDNAGVAGCENPGGSFTIGAKDPDGLKFVLSEVLKATCTGSNGVLGITVTDGTATAYRINNHGEWIAMSGTYVELSVPAGTYDVELQNTTTCISVPQQKVIGFEDSSLEAEVITKGATSCGQDNGSITLDIDGDAPFYYSTDGTYPMNTLTSPYIITGLSAGKYDVKVRDANGCITNFYGVEIQQGGNEPLIAGTIYALSQPTTCEAKDGSIKVTVTGASTYEYILNGELPYEPLPATGIISGLAQGHYAVTVQAAGGGCSDITQTLVLINSDALTIVTNIGVTHSATCSSNNGTMTFTVAGVTTYKYQIDDELPLKQATSQASVTVPGLSVGDHTLTIVDGNECEIPGGTFTIGASTPDDFTFTANQQTAATCTSNGVLKIAVTGSAVEYRINKGIWTSIVGASVEVSVPAGLYDVEVRSSETCVSEPEEVEIELSGSTLEAEFASATTTTCGLHNGSITLNINSGTAPYYYSIDGGILYSEIESPFIINNLSAGFYDIKVKDNLSCTINIYGVEVYQGLNTSVVTGTISAEQQPTCGNTNGSIKVVATGATGYNYSIVGDNGFTDSGTLPAGGIIPNLEAGNYTVTVEAADGSGCSDISQTLALVNSDAATVVTDITVTPAENCSSDGSIEFAINGSNDFEYQIDGTVAGSWITGTPSPITVPNLSVGDHTLYIKDENDCVNSGGNFTIGAEDPDDLEFTLNEVLKATCSGANGVLGITVTDGTATEYRINYIEWIPMSGTYVEISVPAGNYGVELRNSLTCISLPQYKVIGLDESDIEVEAGVITETTCGLHNGSIELKITGGEAPYYYSIDGTTPSIEIPGTTYIINNLPAGKYDIKVSDANSCVTNIYAIEVKQGLSMPIIAGTIYALSQPTCGHNDGSIKIEVTGASSYNYYLNGGPVTPLVNGIISGLGADHYTVTIEAASGSCSDITQTLALVNSDAATVVTDIIVAPAANCSSEDGTMTFEVNGSNTFEYQIDGTVAGSWITGTPSPITVIGLSAGDHTLYIKDENDCVNPGGAFTIGVQNTGFTFALNALAKATCTGSKGLLEIEVLTGIPTEYRINHGLWMSMTGTSVQVPLPAGTYTVEMRTSPTCVSLPQTETIGIDGTSFAASAVENESTSCGESNGSIALTILNGTGPYSYSIDGGVIYTEITSPYIINNLAPGFYDIKVKDGGCITNVYAVEVYQGINTPTIAGTIYALSQPTCGNDNGSIKVIASGASSYQYSLNGVALGSLPTDGIIDELEAGHYVVKVWATGGGCSDITQNLVLVNSDAATVVTDITVTPAANCSSNGSIEFTINGSNTFEYQIDGIVAGSWITGTPSPITVPNLSVGDHTLYIKDENNCVNPGGSFTISADDPDFEFTLDEVLKATCTGSDGVLSITVTNGTATAYRINHGEWIEMSGSYVEISVPAGIYEIELSTSTTCISAPQEKEIGLDASTLAAEVSTTNDTECTGNDGSIELTITAGTGTHYYSIDNGLTYFEINTPNGIINNLSAGFYDIKIKDDNGCITNLYGVEVKQGVNAPIIIGSIVVEQQPTCGNDNGEIKVVATGASSYEYILNGAAPQPLPLDGIIGTLYAGHYTIVIQAGGSCSTITKTLALTNSDAATIIKTSEVTPATTCTSDDGKLTFTVSGAIPYWYYVDADTPIKVTDNNPVEVTGLTTGDHTLTLMDDNAGVAGCENPGGAFTIGAITTDFTYELSQVVPATCSGSNGVLGIKVLTGTATDYRINYGLWVPISGNYVEVSLPAGNYGVELRSSTTCISVPKYQEIKLDDSDFEAGLDNATTTSCGQDNGRITLTIDGGTAPSYYYSIDGTYPSIPFTTEPYVITNLAVGFYNVKVRDEEGCVINIYNVEVKQGTNEPIIVGSIYVNGRPTCGNNNGSIKVEVTGASSYEYSINDGVDYYTLPPTGIITSLYAGHYTVLVQAFGGGCSDISQPLALINSNAATTVANITITDATDCISDDGEITFTVSGAIPYSYKIDTGSYIPVSDNNPVTVPVSMGDHTLTIKDKNDCENPGGAFTIGAASTGFSFVLNEESSATCTDDNGVLSITVTGTATDYRINHGLWMPMAINPMMISLPAGSYEVEVCNTIDCISLPQTKEIGLTASTFKAQVSNIAGTGCGGNGSIELGITPGVSPYFYSIDGSYPNNPLATTPYTINNLSAGFYDIKVRDDAGCIINIYNQEVKQGTGTPSDPPSAVTPQTFCNGAKVSNLQTENGINIKWYREETGGIALATSTLLKADSVYYAEQNIGGCASERTAVKVILDNTIVLDAPDLPGLFEFCEPTLPTPPLTVADIPTFGNTNLVWYNAGGTELTPPLSDYLIADGDIFYVAQSGGGTCISTNRTQVNISFVTETPDAPLMETEQHFCEGALVGNLAKPNTQIVWYKAGETTPLADDELLEQITYEATQKAGDCESDRVEVEVILDQYPEPVTLANQCYKPGMTLADLVIIGAGIKWYQSGVGPLPLTHSIDAGDKYTATQSAGTCESDPVEITIVAQCYDPYGTVFPFVNTVDVAYNNQFETMAKLYPLPPAVTIDKIGYVRKIASVYSSRVTYYDCTKDDPIVGAPKNPGAMGNYNNPGFPINWSSIGISAGIPNSATTSLSDRCTVAPIGKYKFKDVAPGLYVIEITRKGFLTRYGVINVTGSNYLGHREILGGDVNGDIAINAKDLSAISSKKTNYGTPIYNATYDLMGQKKVSSNDVKIISLNFNAYITIYKETDDWANH